MQKEMGGAASIDVVIVLYNSDLKEVKALGMLLENPLVNSVIVCDNSDDGGNHLIFEQHSERIRVFSMGGNAGLSKAYNFAVSKCLADYILILDDDTELPADYFNSVCSYLSCDNADVYMPMVWSREILMSPCAKRGKRFTALNGKEDLVGTTLSGINSGLVVRRSVYDKVHYRESLFLDMVDHAFFDDVRAAGFRTSVMTDVSLMQDYSRETDDFDTAKLRYRIAKRDNRTYFGQGFGNRVFCESQLFYWKLKRAIKFKCLSALAW